jgi:small subunit ribosomal protein S18
VARAPAKTGGKPATRGAGRKGAPLKRKSCHLCRDKVVEVDYKNIDQLRRYLSERSKIRSPRMSGACRRHQRQLAVAIKRAREMALLPYVAPAGPPPSPRGRGGGRDRGASESDSS